MFDILLLHIVNYRILFLAICKVIKMVTQYVNNYEITEVKKHVKAY